VFELFVLPCDFGEMGFVNFELYVGNPSSIVISIDFSEILVRFQEYGIHKVFQRKETKKKLRVSLSSTQFYYC
jgi:hypothetical protein